MLSQAEKDVQFLKDQKRMNYSLDLFKVDRSNNEINDTVQLFFNNSLKAFKSVEANDELRAVFYHMGIVDYFQRVDRSVACETILPSKYYSKPNHPKSYGHNFFKFFAEIVEIGRAHV